MSCIDLTRKSRYQDNSPSNNIDKYFLLLPFYKHTGLMTETGSSSDTNIPIEVSSRIVASIHSFQSNNSIVVGIHSCIIHSQACLVMNNDTGKPWIIIKLDICRPWCHTNFHPVNRHNKNLMFTHIDFIRN